MLLDHFHPPFSEQFGWKSFHTQWAAVITADLNRRLPPGWRAASEAEFGVEIDVGVVDDREPDKPLPDDEFEDELARFGPPVKTIAFAPTQDIVEVRVYNRSYGPDLVGAIELVSPGNKDRPDHREAFVSKCAAILHDGAGLLIVDIVTSRHANTHRALLERLGEHDEFDERLYISAYHPTRGDDPGWARAEIWVEPLAVGSPLPKMPLFLRVGPMMPVDFEATYRETCRELRIPIEENRSSA